MLHGLRVVYPKDAEERAYGGAGADLQIRVPGAFGETWCRSCEEKGRVLFVHGRLSFLRVQAGDRTVSSVNSTRSARVTHRGREAIPN